jgi:hypothetical protein
VKLAFLPISVLGGIVAGIAGKKAFEQLWGLVDEQDPPDAKRRDAVVWKLALALLIEGAIFRLARGLFDHGARRAFARTTGSWPGDESPEGS